MPLQIAAWWLAVSAIGWASLPIARRLFDRLPDDGIAFARPLGLLAVGYLYWVGGLARIVPNNTSGAMFVAMGWIAAGIWLARSDGDWPAFLRARRTLIVSYEVVFVVAFVCWAMYRAAVPNIEPSGGEKYMEIAFLNGILASDGFPPNDPWLSGHSISYYYFGYLIAAILTQLTQVPSAVAFNLVTPMALALTLVGSAGVGYGLAALVPGTGRLVRAVAAGLGATLTSIVGNLEGFLEVAYRQGWGSPQFWNRLDIKNLTVRAGSGLGGDAASRIGCGETELGYATASFWPDRFIWWWRGSRVIHDDCGEIIHEFPFFSFMLGDVHPHVMALPFVVMVVALGLNIVARSDLPLPGNTSSLTSAGLWSPWWLAVAGIVGALGFLNAWDLPTFALVVLGAYALWVLRRRPNHFHHTSADAALAGLGLGAVLFASARTLSGLQAFDPPGWIVACQAGTLGALCRFGESILRALGLVGAEPSGGLAAGALIAAGTIAGGAGLVLRALYSRRDTVDAAMALHVLRFGAFLGAVAIILYLPFYLPLESQVQGVGVVSIRSRPAQWLVHLAIPVFFSGVVLAAGAAHHRRALKRLPGPSMAVLLVAAAFLGSAVVAGDVVPATLAIGMGAAGAACLAMWSTTVDRHPENEAGHKADGSDGAYGEGTIPWAFAAGLAALGLSLLLAVEFFFIRDLFNSRMNSVFKFAYQAWILLGLAGAFAAVVIGRAMGSAGDQVADWWHGRTQRSAVREAPPGSRDRGISGVGGAAGVVGALMLLAGLVFTVASVRTRTEGWRDRGLTLDGLAWWQVAHPGDVAAVDWLRSHVDGPAVIVEAAGDSYQDQVHFSLATGLPTVLGWEFHERQWGRSEDAIGPRKADLERLYKTADSDEILEILARYDARYLVVGPAERSKYDMTADLARFDRVLVRAYDAGGIAIFEVPQ